MTDEGSRHLHSRHVYPSSEYGGLHAPERLDEDWDHIQKYEDFTTIDWIQDSLVERNRRRRDAHHRRTAGRGPGGEITSEWVWMQGKRLLGAGESWLVITAVGIGIGVNAALIDIITEWLSDIKMGYCADGWWLNQQFCCWEIEGDDNACPSWHPWSTVTPARWIIYVLFATLFAFIASHLVRTMAKYAAGSGISEIKCILAGFVMQGFLGLTTFFIKSLTLPLVIASGLSVGKEGPSVHVACCIGSLVAGIFGRFSRSQSKMREIVTAASAAGVAVAFGSPIGGVLFSIEEMSHIFSIKTMWRSFVCALVAGFTLSVMNPFRTGKLVLFQVTYNRDWHFFEIIFFIILGIFGGLYGAFIVKFNIQVASFRRKYLADYAVAEAVFLAVVTAVLSYPNRFLRIDMTEMMAILFRECEGGGDYDNLCQLAVQWPMVNSLLLATFIRMCLVVVSYGCKVPAGIFVPSMAVGATFGRMVGIMVKAMYRAYPQSGMFAVCDPDLPCITPGTYALLGAAAALSGVMRITVSVVVIMFELTGALTYILPTMIVILVTKAVGDYFGTRGIADEMIRFSGYPILEREESDHAIQSVPVSEVMRKDLDVLDASEMRVSQIEQLLSSTSVKGFPIVETQKELGQEKRVLVGYVGRSELRYVLDKAHTMPGHTARDPRCAFVRPAAAASSSSESSQDGRPGTNGAGQFHGRNGSVESETTSGWALGAGDDFEADEMLGTLDDADIAMEGGGVPGGTDGSGGGQGTGIGIGAGGTGGTGGALRVWPWVNQTPLTVSPLLPLEIVMQLFTRMGPRVIIVEERGALIGLVTVKDVLRFTASAKGRPQVEEVPEWTAGELDAVLEMTWNWARETSEGWRARARRMVGR